ASTAVNSATPRGTGPEITIAPSRSISPNTSLSAASARRWSQPCPPPMAASARSPSCDMSPAPGVRRANGSIRVAKEDLLEFDGVVTEDLPDGHNRVKLDNDHALLAYMSGKMRKFRIRTGVGDRVIVEVSPYDLDRGRINFRHKGDRVAGPTPARRPNFHRR